MNIVELDVLDERITALESKPASSVPPTVTDGQLVTALRTILLGGAAAVPPVAAPPVAQGPDSLDLMISNSPGQPVPCTFNVILQRADGTKVGIAGPLTVTSYVGQSQSGAQHFSFKGAFGPGASFIIAPGSDGGGTGGMFLMGATYNLVPLGIWGQDDSRGGDAGGASWTYNSNGAAMTLSSAPPAGYTAPVPAPTDSQINGATLTDLAKVGAVTLPAGTFVGTTALNAALMGAGMGQTIITALNHPLTYNKAILVPSAKGIIIKGVTLTGAKLGAALGGNGAGIRDADTDIGFTAIDTEIYGCDNGILTFGSDVTLHACKFHDNGNPTDGGHTHNVYVGGNGKNTLDVTDYEGYGATSAHDIKSRAAITKIARMKSTAGGQGRNLDVPDGGKVDVTDATWTIPANAADRTFYGFATESMSNGDGGMTTLTNVVFTDLTNVGGQLICIFDTKSVLNLVNCTYKGTVAPKIIGFGTVNGTLAVAA